MVNYTDPSEFEDFAHFVLLGHGLIYPAPDRRTTSILTRWLVRMGVVTESSVPTERGKIYGQDLETTYYEWFHSSLEGKRGELDTSFQVSGKDSSLLHMNQRGSKPVLFLFDLPDPYRTNSDRLLLRLTLDLGILISEEMEVLIHCISDSDNLPNDFWLIKNSEDSLLGRGTERLLKSLQTGQHFVYAFANLYHHATVLEGFRTREGLNVRLTGYFSRSERVPYADSISLLRHKLSPFLNVLGLSEKFDRASKDSIEFKINLGREWGVRKGLGRNRQGDSFQISPIGVLRGTTFRDSQKAIMLIVTAPPLLSSSIPWLRRVSPWLVYCRGRTLDSDLRKGLRFQFHRLGILELDNVVLARVMITPSSQGL